MSHRTEHDRPAKVCAGCGRQFHWRRKWAADWDAVRYCSTACRGMEKTGEAQALEQAILELSAARGSGASLCPSEASRRAFPDDWRRHLQATRSAARRLARRGEIEILQRGRRIDPDSMRGPVRLRIVKS